jgi:chemotaxis protein histidine kinase CheA
MSSLADLPNLAGFFSYSRRDDEDSDRSLSDLRKQIYRELGLLLGRDLKLFQDTLAIPEGTEWEDEINKAISASVFFIPIVTPRAVTSKHCRLEFQAFLDREQALGRKNLVFPLLYIRVPALEKEEEWRQDPLLGIIGRRQYFDWQRFRHRNITEGETAARIEQFCQNIVESLRESWVSPAESRAAEEAEAKRVAEQARRDQEERERLRAEAESRQKAEQERRAAEEAEAQRIAEQASLDQQEKQRQQAEAEARVRAEQECRAVEEAEAQLIAERARRDQEDKKRQEEAQARQQQRRAAEQAEAQRVAEQARRNQDEKKRQQAAAEARQNAEQERRGRDEAQVRLIADQERRRAEAERRVRAALTNPIAIVAAALGLMAMLLILLSVTR